MPIMPLTQRGISTSRLVLGCMPFGGGWNRNPITREDVLTAEQAVDAALSIGISMFDHADMYALGKAEETFGRILTGRPAFRDQIVIQSKCGIRPGEGEVPSRFDFSRDHILAAVDGSLQRLGIDYLDVLLLHRPDPLVEPDEVADAFGRLKAAGKVRYFGVSNMSVAQIRFLQQAIPDQRSLVSVPVSEPSSNGTRAMTPTCCSRQSGKELVFRRLVEDVVDHLDGVDLAGAHGLKRVPRLPAVDADADGADQPLALEIVDGPLPALVVVPRRLPRRGIAGGRRGRAQGCAGFSRCTRGCGPAGIRRPA